SAETVRVYRDYYGVPHVFASSLAGAYFGAGYAMAEDLGYGASNLALQVEGRKSEFFGPGADDANVGEDIEARHFRFYDTARAGFSQLSPNVQMAFRDYAAGIARRYQDEPRPRPDWAIDVTPEDLAAAFLSANFYQSAFESSDHELKEIGVPLQYPYMGSNAFAIGPSRMRDHSTVHFAGPQTPFGDAQPEMHLEWPGGRVAGYGYGLFVDPGVGLNHAWGSTANWPDTSDVYRLRLSQELAYQYWDAAAEGGKGGWVPLTPIEIRFPIRGSASPYTGRRWETRLGPILKFDKGEGAEWAYVWRASGWKRLQYIEAVFRKQWAASAREALRAADPPEAVSGNWILADRWGDIAFLYNARVFGRTNDGATHATQSADDPQTEWADWAYGLTGEHRLPMALNPAGGFLVSANEAPWFAASSGEIPGRDAWPDCLVPTQGWGSGATTRGQRLRDLIGSRYQIALDEIMPAPFDAQLPKAQAWVGALEAAWRAAPQKPVRLSADALAVQETLAAWPGRADADSPAMTALFFLIQKLAPWADPAEAARAEAAPDPAAIDAAELARYADGLEYVAHRLKTDYGKLEVPWGEIHGFAQEGQWTPVGGGTEFLQAIFQAHAGETRGADAIGGDYRIRCTQGSAHLALTVFQGDKTLCLTINPSGQINPQAHPQSPHCYDQRPLYLQKRFKPFWLTEADVKANLTPYDGKPGYEFKALRTLEVPGLSTAASRGSAVGSGS
ncbi:MAG: penicillin acylase family protein, partial [Candidatus Sumerlaeota bacterium]|nr:penicillin acylase family protein [Candidatus Sumerlaeota bacterium]